MSCYSGPEIVNNGLVFHYDMNNAQKSWKGAPTTNLASGNFFYGNGVNFPVNQNVTDTMPDGSIGTARELNAQIVGDPNRTVSIGTFSLTAGATYTLSFYAKNINCTGFGGNLYSTTLGRTISPGITYPTLNTKTWTRVVTTFTVPNEGPNPVVLAPQVFRDGGIGYFRLCWLMLEQSSIVSPFVASSRSTTQAILDLTKNNTLTVSNLSYSSNNTFSFDGTDDYILVPNNFIPANSPLTISIWIKILTMPTNGKIVDCMNDSVAWDGFSLRVASGQIRFSLLKTYDPNVSITLGTLSSVVTNTWYSIDATYDGSSVKLYINGKLDNSQNYSSGYDVGQPNIGIGARPSGVQSTNCQIPKVQMYNRALSATEVKQNFEATRDRFGI